VLKTGIDLVTFSGDKLLGGVQAGVIVGRRDLLDAIKQNPMKRALRADKITLAALEATLKLYETPESLPHTLPLLRTLTLAPEELDILGDAIIAVLPHPWSARLTETTAQIGSGALPDKTIASRALALAHPALNADQMAARLRDLPNAVIGRISGGSLLLDLRGAQPLSELLQTLSHLAP
jgi:L-seryl-tRNA(Ser) seleniumtransferase